MAGQSVSALSDRAVNDTPVGTLEATMETGNEHIGALKLQVLSNDSETVPKVAQADGLEGRLRTSEKRAPLMLSIIHEHGTQLWAAEGARSSAKVALRSAESHLQVVCASGSSIQEEAG